MPVRGTATAKLGEASLKEQPTKTRKPQERFARVGCPPVVSEMALDKVACSEG